MEKTNDTQHRAILKRIAHRVMRERGLEPDFPPDALAQLEGILAPQASAGGATRDLKALLWCSIDNDDSRDLDQLTVAEALPGGGTRVRVAIADVDALVKKLSALDAHAAMNTTSVYTVGETFPMLPERLSTDLTSLGQGEARIAVVVDMAFAADGSIDSSELYVAIVRNRAKLAYNAVGAWLEGSGPEPEALAAVAGLDEAIRLQDRTAVAQKELRRVHGALDFATLEARPIFDGDELKDLKLEIGNRAKDIIAEFMIAANGVTARYLSSKGVASLRRIVRTPKRWERIVELAEGKGGHLPPEPDSKALELFLASARVADPRTFPDLSLSIIKLLGRGEYAVEVPGQKPEGHFGLAVMDYAHTTAPNRRYPDLISQRLIKAAIGALAPPYSIDELVALAKNCTEKEDAAKKVERQVVKSAAAILLEARVGERFEAIVTGASEKGTWVRLQSPPVEGRLEKGYEGVDVGQELRVQLLGVDVERGFLDFARLQ